MNIKEKIDSFKYRGNVETAIALQNELAYYTEYNVGAAHEAEFRKRVSVIYNGKGNKVDRFMNAFKGKILPSLEIMDTVWGELYKVFDPQDSVYHYEFSNEAYEGEGKEYIESTRDFWKTKAWSELKTKFNSILIVDVAKEQKGNKPEPYRYFIDIKTIRYIEFYDEKIKEIIFECKGEDGEPNYHYYTDLFYSVYDKDYMLISEAPHKLGYCPAEFLSNEYLNSSSQINRKNNCVTCIEEIFKYNFKTIEAFKADLLYLNPDKQAPMSSCGYDANGQRCVGGKLVDMNKQPVFDSGTHKLCPACGNDQHNSGGAGNLISIDYNSAAVIEGKVSVNQDLTRYINPPIDGNKEQYTRLISLKESLIKSMAGADTVQTKEAVNEKQQEANYQNREAILKGISDLLSHIITWSDTTMLKLRYADKFKSCSVFMGSKFYIRTVDELLAMHELATNPIIKGQIIDQIINVKYRNNSQKRDREMLLFKLLPYAEVGDKEFDEYVKAGKVSNEDFVLRSNFHNIITDFEADRGNILTWLNTFFRETVNMYQRIKIIREELKKYYIYNVKEEKPIVEPIIKEDEL